MSVSGYTKITERRRGEAWRPLDEGGLYPGDDRGEGHRRSLLRQALQVHGAGHEGTDCPGGSLTTRPGLSRVAVQWAEPPRGRAGAVALDARR